MDFYERADSQEGWYNLGQLYWTGFPETDDVDRAQQPPIVTPDHQKALDCFKKAVEKGDADAMYFVGAQYVLEETSEGITKGLDLIQQAADTGHPGALNYLASFFYHGSPVLNIQPASTEENVERLDKAAEAGDQDALYTRGHAFLQGDDGRPQHFGKAFEDFMQAAHKGHPEAAVSAGAMLFNGMGVAIDQTRAFEMYQLAGELGSKEGWRNVVACYTDGTGVKQCTKTAKYIQSLML